MANHLYNESSAQTKNLGVGFTNRRSTDEFPLPLGGFILEPSSAHPISPADAVRRYWHWRLMPETMRRLA